MKKPHASRAADTESLVEEAAEEAVKAHPGRLHEASRDLLSRIRRDPRLSEAMVERLLLEACADRVRRILQRRNSRAWHGPDFDPTQRGDRLRRAARTSLEFKLMDYTLIGGKPLGLATRDEVARNADFQDKQARRMSQTAMWFALIEEEMGRLAATPSALVRDLLSEDKLRELQQLAKGEWVGNEETSNG